MSAEHLTTRAAVERAGTYAPALFPATVAGLVRWTLTTYLEQGNEASAWGLAIAVIENAEAAGWSAESDQHGFLQAIPPADRDQTDPGWVTVYRHDPSAAWELLGSKTTACAADHLDVVLAEAARQAIDHPGLVIRYQDNGALSKRESHRGGGGE